MRILFLSRWYPYPPDNGSKVRIFNIIKYLARSHDITLISFAEEMISSERLAAMREFCSRVEVTPYKRFQPTSGKALRGFFSRKPRSFIDTFSRELQGQIESAEREMPFDVVIASQVDMAPYALALPTTPKILEEIEISIFHDQYIKEFHPLKKARKRLMWGKWLFYMAEVLRQYDGCTVVSEPEIEPIQKALPGYQPVALIPNGADIERFTGDFGQPECNTLVYTGALTYYVNFDAMKFFLGEVFPLILAQCPEVKLYMAGHLEGVAMDELPKHDNAIFTGHLADIRHRVAGSWLSIVPERVGGGTRIKVPESMALGTPVVATTRGATGLDVRHGEDILVADTPEDFAAAVLRVLKDPQLRETLSRNGRRTVEEKYDWKVIVHQFDTFIQSVVTQRNSK